MLKELIEYIKDYTYYIYVTTGENIDLIYYSVKDGVITLFFNIHNTKYALVLKENLCYDDKLYKDYIVRRLNKLVNKVLFNEGNKNFMEV